MEAPSLEQCQQRLQDAELKVTQQRLLIYRALHEVGPHPDAESLFAALQPQNPTLSLGTVYRTLDSFVQAGLVQRFAGEEGRMRFDPNLDKHHHLIDGKSKEVHDFVDPDLTALIAQYFAQKPIPGFEIADFQLNIHGKTR